MRLPSETEALQAIVRRIKRAFDDDEERRLFYVQIIRYFEGFGCNAEAADGIDDAFDRALGQVRKEAT